MNSSVTSAALNQAVGSNVTAIDITSGGAVLVNSSRMTADVDSNTVVLSGMPAASYTHLCRSLLCMRQLTT